MNIDRTRLMEIRGELATSLQAAITDHVALTQSIERIRDNLKNLDALINEAAELEDLPPPTSKPPSPLPPVDEKPPQATALVQGPDMSKVPPSIEPRTAGQYLDAFATRNPGDAYGRNRMRGSGTGVRVNTAKDSADYDAVSFRLSRADRIPNNAATSTHEVHLPHTPVRQATFSIEVMFRDTDVYPFDWGKTGKIGGLVGFNDQDPEWSTWPGGSRHGPANFSIRNTFWRWHRDGDPKPEPRLGLYLYMGGKVDADPLVFTAKDGTKPYVSNGGHSAEFLLHKYGTPPVNKWIHIENYVDAGRPGQSDGRVIVRVQGSNVLEVEGIPFSTEGVGLITQAYLSLMFGGGDGFQPDTDSESAIIAYRNLDVQGLVG